MSNVVFASSSDNQNYDKSMKLPDSWLNATQDSNQQVVKNHDKGSAGVHLDVQPNPSFDQPAKVTARIDMSANVAGQGLCPECRTPMKASHASGVPVLVCAKDRISLPLPDQAE